MWVLLLVLTGVLVQLLSILLASTLVMWYLVAFFLFKKNIWCEIQLDDALVVGSFEPPDARAACDGICKHFAYESYLLKVW